MKKFFLVLFFILVCVKSFAWTSGWQNDYEFNNLYVTGNVGINTQDTGEVLDINGRVLIEKNSAPSVTTDKLYNVGGSLYWNGTDISAGGVSSQWTTAGSNIYYKTGNVGIGTSVPGYTLQVDGSLGIGSSIPAKYTSAPTFTAGSNQMVSVKYVDDAVAGVGTDYIKKDGSIEFSGNQSMGENNIFNVGNISLDSVTGDSGAISIGAGSDTITLNPTTETSFSDKNITNVGSIALDSVIGDAGAISIGAGSDTITLNPTAETSFSDKNITNVGDISLDSISSDAGTTVAISLGSDKGDDLLVDTDSFVVKGNENNVGIGTTAPAQKLDVQGSIAVGTSATTYSLLLNNKKLRGTVEKCTTLTNVASTDDNVPMGMFSNAVNIKNVWCSYVGTGTTKALFSLEDGSGNALAISNDNPVCVASGTNATKYAVTQDTASALDAGELLRFDVTNTPSPETDTYTICVDFENQ